jgi:hypothetical protein
MSYKIATVSSRMPAQWYYLQKEFYKSLNGHEVVTINYQDTQPWDGFSMKPKWLYRAIKESLIDTDLMIFTDSWDVLFAAEPKEVIERYLSFGADVVINAEKNCFPAALKDQFDKIETPPTEYKYLNSGFIVGKTEAILACLETMDLPNVPGDYYDTEKKCNVHPEDQTMWQQAFLKQPVSIALDYYCALSQTLHDANMGEFDFSEKRIRNKATNSYPCVFHLNGSAKDKLHIRNPVLKHLNLL